MRVHARASSIQTLAKRTCVAPGGNLVEKRSNAFFSHILGFLEVKKNILWFLFDTPSIFEQLINLCAGMYLNLIHVMYSDIFINQCIIWDKFYFHILL